MEKAQVNRQIDFGVPIDDLGEEQTAPRRSSRHIGVLCVPRFGADVGVFLVGSDVGVGDVYGKGLIFGLGSRSGERNLP